MYIEDYLAAVAQFTCPTSHSDFIRSIAGRLDIGMPLTQKQALRALQILTHNKQQLAAISSTVTADLAYPAWKVPPLANNTSKTVNVIDDVTHSKILVVYSPYDMNVISVMRTIGEWDSINRRWWSLLTERNISVICQHLVSQGFNIADDILNWWHDITDAQLNIASLLPMVCKKGDRYCYANQHTEIPALDTDDIIAALFTARDYGITVWDDAVEVDVGRIVTNPITLSIIKRAHDAPPAWAHPRHVPITLFADLFKYGEQILVVIAAGEEPVQVPLWLEAAMSFGLSASQISMACTLPKATPIIEFALQHEIKNKVSATTKLVMVNAKVPNHVIRSGIEFGTVIYLGHLGVNPMTSKTIRAAVSHVKNIIYYSITPPKDFA